MQLPELSRDSYGDVLASHSGCSLLVQAFSHFSYDYADARSLIVDIQGVDREWTDPQMHSECGGRCGPGDPGHVGIKRFFASHRRKRAPLRGGGKATSRAAPEPGGGDDDGDDEEGGDDGDDDDDDNAEGCKDDS